MARDHAGLQAVLREITRSPERSDLFRWMVEHHTELIAASKGRRLHWRSLCDRFAQLGLNDVTGKAATPATARKTWLRARAAVAAAQRQAAATPPPPPGPFHASRLPPDWRPEEVTPATSPQKQPGTAVAAVPPLPPLPRPPSVLPIMRARPAGTAPKLVPQHEIDAMIAGAFGDLAKADWYLMAGKPKRKDE